MIEERLGWEPSVGLRDGLRADLSLDPRRAGGAGHRLTRARRARTCPSSSSKPRAKLSSEKRSRA